ncbi:MAG: hypothetical protein K6C68_02435, partial [Ruminococcus sp.]|nr:hypothetical protein [Ruminococcus sp.]
SHWRIFIWLTRKTCWLDEVRPAKLKQVGYISLGIYLVFSVHCAVLPYYFSHFQKHLLSMY